MECCAYNIQHTKSAKTYWQWSVDESLLQKENLYYQQLQFWNDTNVLPTSSIGQVQSFTTIVFCIIEKHLLFSLDKHSLLENCSLFH